MATATEVSFAELKNAEEFGKAVDDIANATKVRTGRNRDKSLGWQYQKPIFLDGQDMFKAGDLFPSDYHVIRPIPAVGDPDKYVVKYATHDVDYARRIGTAPGADPAAMLQSIHVSNKFLDQKCKELGGESVFYDITYARGR